MEKNKFMVRVSCMTYNQSSFITDALNGFVMQQTSFPFVCTIIDDASTDGEQKVIKDYVQEHFDLRDSYFAYEDDRDYGHVTFARHKNNKNCFFAVVYLKENHYSQNKSKAPYLVEWTDTKYVAFCEGDDYWIDPLKLQKQVDLMETHNEVGLCYTDYCVRTMDGKVSPAVFESGADTVPSGFEDHLLRAGYIAPMSWFWRRTYKDLWQNSMSFIDGTFAVALEFYKNTEVAFLPDVTSVYRVSDGSASHPGTKEKQLRYQLDVYKTQLLYSEKYRVGPELVDKIKSKAYFELLPLAIETNRKDFMEEAAAFFDSKNIYYSGLMGLCHQLAVEQREKRKMEKELNGIRSSKAYRIGKRVTKTLGGIVKKSKE